VNSFILRAVGILARSPERVWREKISGTRFCLTGTDCTYGSDENGQPRFVAMSVWFLAFGPMAQYILDHSRKGDQLIVEARVRKCYGQDGERQRRWEHEYVVTGFRLGAQKLTATERIPAGSPNLITTA
jgi:hypothetical protein